MKDFYTSNLEFPHFSQPFGHGKILAKKRNKKYEREKITVTFITYLSAKLWYYKDIRKKTTYKRRQTYGVKTFK